MNIEIRQEQPSDIKDVFNVVKLAFENAEFSNHDEQNLVNKLRISKYFIPQLSLVALYQKNIVGYILFTEVKVSNNTLLALAPIAVIPSMQGQGIGKRLILAGHRIAKELGYKGCIVMGHDKYYPKFGYNKASQYNILPPFDCPDECFMAIEFFKDSLKAISGTVEYTKEFLE